MKFNKVIVRLRLGRLWFIVSGFIVNRTTIVWLMSRKSLPSSVCATVKKLRLQKGISQEQLALLAELDRSYVSGIEREQKNITFATLEKIIPHISDSEEEFLNQLITEIKND